MKIDYSHRPALLFLSLSIHLSPFLESSPSLARRITPMPESFDFFTALSRIPLLCEAGKFPAFFLYPILFRNNRVRSYLCPHMHIAGRPQTAPRTIREASQEVISKKQEKIFGLWHLDRVFYISAWADSIKISSSIINIRMSAVSHCL